ncbi:unnamed protein product [Schistocephalus solidus]|uniref:TYR_PHOSPHATASE_2 domain-containing protein n=1 Tax=Schistocephalus solidus TaxID=70667 RepID=A0A183T0F4_SCHSO|nr:unnamed protein product [Schistocephalus solidus]
MQLISVRPLYLHCGTGLSFGILILTCIPVRFSSPSVAAGLAACVLTRRCANLAFQKFRRSTVTLKLIDEIQTAFEQLFLPK